MLVLLVVGVLVVLTVVVAVVVDRRDRRAGRGGSRTSAIDHDVRENRRDARTIETGPQRFNPDLSWTHRTRSNERRGRKS